MMKENRKKHNEVHNQKALYFDKYFYGEVVKQDDMIGTRNTHGIDKQCICD